MKNPNASVAFISAAPGGQLILELSSQFGWTISPGLAIYISGALAYLVLFVGRNGLRGAARLLLNGKPQKEEP